MRGMRRGKEGLIWEGGFIKRYTFGNVNSSKRMLVAISFMRRTVTQEETLG